MIQQKQQSVFRKHRVPFCIVLARQRPGRELASSEASRVRMENPGLLLGQQSHVLDAKGTSSQRHSLLYSVFAFRKDGTKSAVSGDLSVVSCARNRGFTLIELLVTLGIFLIMTGGVLSNYRGYGTNVLFANASEDVILALRQAQIFGVGVKGENSQYTLSYGVHFSTAQNQKSEIVIFSDGNNNRIYNPELGEVRIEKTTWLSNISILSLVCDGVSCGSNAYVTFKRPNADAFIANTENQANPFNTLAVTVEDSTTGKTSTIKVTSAGQISLQ